MKNYAGHRLSPWLGHLMVSRQETARPLLTPGEMMQLLPADEIVLVSGAPPIRARKARYYEDRQLRTRILAPPEPAADQRRSTDTPVTDEWSGCAPIAARMPASGKEKAGDEDSDGGARREPALPEHEAIAPDTPAREEFAALDDEPDDEAQRAKQMQGRFRSVARQAALDPDDGIEL